MIECVCVCVCAALFFCQFGLNMAVSKQNSVGSGQLQWEMDCEKGRQVFGWAPTVNKKAKQNHEVRIKGNGLGPTLVPPRSGDTITAQCEA